MKTMDQLERENKELRKIINSVIEASIKMGFTEIAKEIENDLDKAQ